MKLYTFYIGRHVTRSDGSITVTPVWAVLETVEEAFNEFVIDGYTMTESVGYWKGEREPTVVVTVASGDLQDFAFKGACEYIREQLEQEAVLLTCQSVEVL